MNAKIKIEFNPGTSIEEAFKEAIRVSRILWVTTEFNFNGVTCWGCPNGDFEIGSANYTKALKPEIQHKFANSR